MSFIGLLVLLVLLVLLGALVRRLLRANGAAPPLQIDLSRPRDRKMLGLFLGGSVVFLLVTSFETYNSYHFTESVQFCGRACHTVMEPELVSYQHGPHAKVACTECHIGPGATWYDCHGHHDVLPASNPASRLSKANIVQTCKQCHTKATAGFALYVPHANPLDRVDVGFRNGLADRTADALFGTFRLTFTLALVRPTPVGLDLVGLHAFA